MRRILVIFGAVIALLAGIATYAAVSKRAEALPVREAVIRAAPFAIKLPETGVLQVPQLVAVPAQIAGNLGSLGVRAGDRVVRGQVLATIDNPQIAANLADAQAAQRSATAHASSVAETNGALPAQSRSSVVQAQAAVVQARATLVQARQDLVAGSQSGLGYGGQTAEEQRVLADSSVSRADTDLREAKRIYDANRYLLAQKAISQDTLDQSLAKYQEALVGDRQAGKQRQILGGTLTRNTQVLHDRVGATQDGLRQAEAALDSARAAAAESKSGDLEAANADAGKARADLSFASDQVGRLEIRSPIDGTVQAVATETGDALRPLQQGDPVVAGQAIVTLAAPGGFIVRTRVDEQDVASIAVGQHATVGGEDFGNVTLPGHIVAISPIAQKSDDPSNTSRQVLTTIALDRRLPFLRDGMSVDVDIETLALPHALFVPIDALRHDGSRTYVYVDRGGKVARANVTTGKQNDTHVVIASGLAAGSVVITDKAPSLATGVPVTAATASPAPTPAPS